MCETDSIRPRHTIERSQEIYGRCILHCCTRQSGSAAAVEQRNITLRFLGGCLANACRWGTNQIAVGGDNDRLWQGAVIDGQRCCVLQHVSTCSQSNLFAFVQPHFFHQHIRLPVAFGCAAISLAAISGH